MKSERTYTYHESEFSLKFASGAENLVSLAQNSQAGQAYVIMDLMRALWRVNLLLVLNRSLLNKEYNLINVL
jgi:hypothetical protein